LTAEIGIAIEPDNIPWKHSVSDDGEAVIGWAWYTGDLCIPSLLDGYPVTATTNLAFWCCPIVSATVPDSVRTLGEDTFVLCTNLVSAALGNGVTDLTPWTFGYCSALRSVMLPPGVTNIGNCAFYECTSLKTLDIPSGVATIGDEAFAKCSNLEALVLPPAVKSVGDHAFGGCTALETLYVPMAWKWLDVLDKAALPETCEIVYCGEEGETATETPVPYSWLEAKAAAILKARDGDHDAAANAKAENGRRVWECYVAGLDPAAKRDFRAEISFGENGKPVISSNPRDEETRKYTVYGKTSLTDVTEEWADVTENPDPEADGYRFFRVGVELRGNAAP